MTGDLNATLGHRPFRHPERSEMSFVGKVAFRKLRPESKDFGEAATTTLNLSPFFEDLFMEFQHTTVLLHEMIDRILTDSHGIYVDCTLGGGGHSFAMAEKLAPDALLIFMRRTIPAEPSEPVEPAPPLSHVIKGQHAQGR